MGTWWGSGYCTIRADRTPHGEICSDACDARGYSYSWCHKTTLLWGYCTPQALIDRAELWRRLQGDPSGGGGVDVRGRVCTEPCSKVIKIRALIVLCLPDRSLL